MGRVRSRFLAFMPFCPAVAFEFCVGIYMFLVFAAVDIMAVCDVLVVHDALDALSGVGQSHFRLRMFRRCLSVDQLGDIWKERGIVSDGMAGVSLPFVTASFCDGTQPVDDFPLYDCFYVRAGCGLSLSFAGS